MPETVVERTERPAVNSCPCCGAEVAKPLMVYLGRNVIAASGQEVKVTPYVADFISVLNDAYPETVPRETIKYRLYGHSGGAESATEAVYATHARKALNPLGWTIAVVYKRGYRLEQLYDPYQQ